MNSTIPSRSRAQKSAKTRARKKNPLRAAKLVAKREVPADGIERRKSKVTGEWMEFCVTPESTAKRRLEVFWQATGFCQGDDCGWNNGGNESDKQFLGSPEGHRWHWHHKKFRSQGGDDSLSNAQALCPKCHDQKHGIKSGVGRTMRTTI